MPSGGVWQRVGPRGTEGIWGVREGLSRRRLSCGLVSWENVPLVCLLDGIVAHTHGAICFLQRGALIARAVGRAEPTSLPKFALPRRVWVCAYVCMCAWQCPDDISVEFPRLGKV